MKKEGGNRIRQRGDAGGEGKKKRLETHPKCSASSGDTTLACRSYIKLKRGDRTSVMDMFSACSDTLEKGSSVMIFPEVIPFPPVAFCRRILPFLLDVAGMPAGPKSAAIGAMPCLCDDSCSAVWCDRRRAVPSFLRTHVRT